MNSELHEVAVCGDEGHITTTGLQVTSEALAMDSELQKVSVRGGGDGRITTKGVQVNYFGGLELGGASYWRRRRPHHHHGLASYFGVLVDGCRQPGHAAHQRCELPAGKR